MGPFTPYRGRPYTYTYTYERKEDRILRKNHSSIIMWRLLMISQAPDGSA